MIGILKYVEVKELFYRWYRGWLDYFVFDLVFFLEIDKVFLYFFNMIMLCKLIVFCRVYMNNRDIVYDVWKLYFFKLRFINWGWKLYDLIYIILLLYGICV